MPRDGLSVRGSEDTRPCPLRYITAISRCWGILTAIGLWGSTIEILRDLSQFFYVGWYLIAISILVTFFELMWILNKSACCVEEGTCCLIWKGLLWIDEWKKTLLYLAFSIPCFLRGPAVLMGIVSGLLLNILGIFYLVKSFRDSKCCQRDVEIDIDGTPTSQTTSLMQSEVNTQTDLEPLESQPNYPNENSPTQGQDENVASSFTQTTND
ncbi:unnamed protein product [Owenia fusiformis]|uniref:Uncharacterized protein n=1 Tax=Owenia fusiformis TaxID=6347 RepID=A0A8J1U2F5_OWEFU|nr:unnamed protein product [Owenia fusiformis]